MALHVDLSGPKALVTGSTRGIGHAIATRLAGYGADVAINGRTVDATEATVEKLRQSMPHARPIAAAGDIATPEGAGAAFTAAGRVDILVNNVGVFDAKPAFEITDEDWSEIFRINVLTAVRATRHYGPRMRAEGWGRIINIGSEAGAAPPTELIHYAASKAALHAMSRGFEQALSGSGVAVNTLLVGPTARDDATRVRTARAHAADQSLEKYERMFFKEQRPTSIIARYVQADEVAQFAAFLSSPRQRTQREARGVSLGVTSCHFLTPLFAAWSAAPVSASERSP